MDIYLHIGAAKCASSSIQGFFSKNNIIGDFSYGCLRASGEILTEDKVKRASILSSSNYAVSSTCNDRQSGFELRLKTEIDSISNKSNKLLLSCEGWNYKYNFFDEVQAAFKGHNVYVIFIVRPPVEWMNSSWWQWQQWSDSDIETWVETTNVAKSWVTAYKSYASLEFVNQLYLVSLDENIVGQVAKVMGIAIDEQNIQHNASSSSELLNFLKVKRSLRKDEHDPHAEFVLNKHIPSHSKADWVLSDANVKNIIEVSRDSLNFLATKVINENLDNNPAWWSFSYYQDRVKKLERNRTLNSAELATMLEESYHAIINMDIKLRRQDLVQSQVESIRDLALNIERTNLDAAYKLMQVASILRPQGPLIKHKLKEYKSRLGLK
jgi:hypothetical protein